MPPAPRLRVVSAANARYLPGVLVTFRSLLQHLAPAWAVDFTLLTDDTLDEPHRLALRRVLQAAGRDHTLDIVGIDLEEYAHFPALYGSRLAYARLLMPRLIAEDRALYLDCDIVVGKDVSALAALPWPEGCLLYAVNDPRITTFAMPWEAIPCEPLGIPPSAPYFNSGFLWVNLAEWRRQDIENATREYIRRFPDGVRWHDQSVLNAVLWNRWHPLDRAWNSAPEQTMGRFEVYPFRPALDVNVHYLGKEKPWLETTPFQYFYEAQAAGIAALAPEAFPARRAAPGERVRRLGYFAKRAFFNYGGFVRRKLLGRGAG